MTPTELGAPHPLHSPDRVWQETNCYADLWIELLHSRGLDPVPAMAAALAAGFDGEQWTFVKPQPEDLLVMYAARVAEINIWRPLLDHVRTHLALGHSLTVEVDSFWLPDTAATTYRTRHAKTTIAVVDCHPPERRLDYLHGSGRFELVGEDFDGVLRTDPDAAGLVPYVESVSWNSGPESYELPALARRAAEASAAHRPPGNPIDALADRLRADLTEVGAAGVETFHDYAFGTARQCGATMLLSADVCRWLAEHPAPGTSSASTASLGEAATHFDDAAQAARVLQFQLARVAAGRRNSVDEALLPLTAAYAAADKALDDAGLARGK